MRQPVPSLAKYRTKRDFTKTSEPAGGKQQNGNGARVHAARGLAYVIQKHAARRLHYDFRLELDGALLSWAVPKGPSLDPSVKRLAVEVEPHPLEYGSFEGTIPKGEYGGGTVMVWDRGTWVPEGDPRKDYARGRLGFTLKGDKLHGAWHLVRTRQGDKGEKTWLLFKSRDEHARAGENAVLEEAPNSVASGRDLEAIAEGRPARKKAKGAAVGPSEPAKAAKPGKLEKAPEPELATLVDAAPDGDAWLHELKFDGYRVLVRISHGAITLLTRRGNDWTARMPGVARAFERLKVDAALLDGEVVVLDEQGRSNFQRLQNSLSGENDEKLVYYAFDLLHLNGKDLRALPLSDRKQALAELLRTQAAKSDGVIRLSEHVVGQGPEFFRKACALGVEGIVSKRATATYRAGRGRDWLKVKCLLRQEFVVVGYSAPAGSRSHLGALLLGIERDGKLTYSGRVGTGFTERSLAELAKKLEPLVVGTPPVVNAPRGAEVRSVRWVKPELVAEVAFTGFTGDGLLRHPTFQGLREDKPAAEVKPEIEPRATKKRARTTPPTTIEYPLTNPDKVMYPEQGITKRDLLEHYALVAERMLPHVRNRPLTLVRCPNGRGKPCFFQKHPSAGTPDAIRSVSIREKDGKAPYSVIDDEQGLFGLVQLGSLEIHTWGSRADDFEHPDLLVFDLDPDPALDFTAVIDAAKLLRRTFEGAKLESFVKTAGGKGLHVCVPIVPDLDWTTIKDFCRRVAEDIARSDPKRYVATVTKAKRTGKIFIDYLRNARSATFVAPYSTRAREGATVAVPLEWDELTPQLRPGAFTVRNLAERLARLRQDPFERMTTVHQRLRP
jgi:bifunctional non-homologous end joining protein LigD